MRDPTKERHHGDDHERPRRIRHARQDVVAQPPDRGAHHGPDDHTWTEDAPGSTRSDGKPGRQDLGERQRQDYPQRQREQARSHADLHPAVAHAQCLWQDQPDQAYEQSTNASFHPLGEAQPVKAVSDPIEAARIEQSDESAQEAEHHVVQQLRRGGKGEAAVRDEDRIPAGPSPEHAVADDRGDERGNNCLDFQVVFVEDFGCQHRPAQGGAEDGADACANPGRDGDAPVLDVQVQETSEQRAKPRANLRRRSFASSRPTRADRDGRGHQLHQWDARANGLTLMKGGDCSVGAMSLGLRCQAEHNDARNESPHCSDDRQEPGTRCGPERHHPHHPLACRVGRQVANQRSQEKVS